MKATVYRISGAILSGNYVQFPKATSQSLGLTGRFTYLLFRPLPTKYFSVHFEVATDTGLAVRVSLSNLFKEFKCTSTWLQIPFSLPQAETEKSDTTQVGRKYTTPKFSQVYRWTLLVIDFRATLTKHLNAKFAYIKNIKLCANLLVKGVFASDTEYSPLANDATQQSGVQPLPRDMSFPLGNSEDFTEVYDFVRFPSETGVCREIGCVKLGDLREGIRGHSTVGFVSVEAENREEGVMGRRLNKNRVGLRRDRVSNAAQ